MAPLLQRSCWLALMARARVCVRACMERSACGTAGRRVGAGSYPSVHRHCGQQMRLNASACTRRCRTPMALVRRLRVAGRRDSDAFGCWMSITPRCVLCVFVAALSLSRTHIHTQTHFSVCLSVCLSLCLSVCLSVSVSLSPSLPPLSLSVSVAHPIAHCAVQDTPFDSEEKAMAFLLEQTRSFAPEVQTIIRSTKAEALIQTDVYDCKAIPCRLGGVVLVGDAGHAVVHHFGQGACLAIEDAVALAASIHRHAHNGVLEGDGAAHTHTITHIHTLTQSHTLTHTYSHTHSHLLSHTLTHSRAHTHTLTHTHTFRGREQWDSPRRA